MDMESICQQTKNHGLKFEIGSCLFWMSQIMGIPNKGVEQDQAC